MRIWVIDGDERFPTDTVSMYEGQERSTVEEALALHGHCSDEMGRILIAGDTVRKMADHV